MKIYDASNQIFGRFCSQLAKELLKGEKIIVVNSEKAILSGNPKFTQKKYLEKIQRGDPHKGPFFPRYPDQILRRTIRGMLPWDRAKGREAFRRLKVFIGIPEEFKNKPLLRIESADAKRLKTRYITLSELSIYLGAKRRW